LFVMQKLRKSASLPAVFLRVGLSWRWIDGENLP
jgi:hypothetical protein